MLKRPLFWLGLLLGACATTAPFSRRPTKALPSLPTWPLELPGAAIIVCNQAGEVTRCSQYARSLFGEQAEGITWLCYPNGQRVPLGQLPLARALRTRENLEQTGYRLSTADGSVRILDAWANTLPDGGGFAVFRDVTAQHEACEREAVARVHQKAVGFLCRRLEKAATVEEIARAAVESVRLLLETVPEAQVRLYSYHSESQNLTRLASDPEDQPKRPVFSADSQPPRFLFDAQVPAIWQLYVGRRPTTESLLPFDASSGVAYALPLIAAGTALGHLSLTAPTDYAFDNPVLSGTLATLASLTAQALNGPVKAESIVELEGRAEALRLIVQVLGTTLEQGRLAEIVTGHIRRVIPCQVCTLSVPVNGKLTVLGNAVQDDLLFPERTASSDPALHSKTIQKAWRTQKTVLQSGIVNPAFEAGPWRAFAGTSGRHSLCAVPLAAKLGVLTVYTNGAVPLPEASRSFMEMVAALVSLTMTQATVPKAAANC